MNTTEEITDPIENSNMEISPCSTNDEPFMFSSIRSLSIHENLTQPFDSILFGWGATIYGELGVGGIEEDYVHVPMKTKWKYEQKIKSVCCGENHTLVITFDGRIFSCGNNDYGQLGHDKSRTRLHQVVGLESHRIVNAACGKHHSIALNEWGQLFSWGRNSHGQLGLEIPIESVQTVPKIIKGLATKNVVQVTCGYQHCLALTNDGGLYAWGSNEFGQLGNQCGFMSACPVSPVAPLFGMAIAFITCGGYHSFCISKSGAVFGWGKNQFGQLGLNNSVDQNIPHQLFTLRSVGVKYITCGEEFSVFLTKDGGVFTCGSGMYGQLGHGSFTAETLPKKVLELMGSTVTQVSCGKRHTLTLIPSKSRVYAFGLGGLNPAKNTSHKDVSIPQMVQGPWYSTSTTDNGKEEEYSVKCIYSGGDRCFVTVAKKTENVDPDDFRYMPPETQVLVINEEILTTCQNIKSEHPVDLDLIYYLEVVMSSVSCLNGSFICEVWECNPLKHGVDIKRATECFSIISRFQHPSLLQTVLRSVSSMLEQLPKTAIDPELLRVYIILPLYHEFMNPKNCDELQIPYGRRLLDVISHLEEWYKYSCSSEYFEALILIYKNVLVDQLRLMTPNNRIGNPKLLIPLQLLSKLNTLNCSLVDDEFKVPYSTFHVHELNELVNISADYLRWLREPHRDICFCNYPFLFDAEAKTTLLQTDQCLQMQHAVNDATTTAIGRLFFSQQFDMVVTQFLEINVSRQNIVGDAIRELSMHNANDLKKPLRVHFLGEEAEDAGGVRKEFFMLVFREILDPKYGMFQIYEETRTIWFRETTFEEDNMFFMIGLLCGLAIYNFTIVNLSFPLVLYKKILNEPVKLQDVKDLSPTIYNSLNDLLNYEGNDLDEVFSLNFVIVKEIFGENLVLPLKENGENIPVTQENKKEFVDLYVDMLLNKSVENYFNPFKQGLLKVCGGRVLQLFRSQELMAVVIGNEDYDWYELENNTEYKKGYDSSNATIQMFWQVFHEFSLEDKKKFLLFLTGSDRIPIQGMKAIKITIQPTTDEKYLPVAHTCFNLLDLPMYQTKERLKYKLLQAIQQTQGFSLV